METTKGEAQKEWMVTTIAMTVSTLFQQMINILVHLVNAHTLIKMLVLLLSECLFSNGSEFLDRCLPHLTMFDKIWPILLFEYP
jgi:hypothetical protein